ncbi:MAG: hypothetical protein A2004_10810 [Spirochaetes bacterium GWC1_61_12]|nr:MAG: hypothetical protein A2Y37_00330 [Spirochaetes bacterium GWB1_60_80]OHD28915.1 MAG: hypothetical protein A2004_10810 [Spirochaetes bacterium GWC1_61_12]OHD43550.1 MAG: hypothetical protein A2Y35_04730 [Spirochaetes bacterium GWE1_60_18]OHD59017.1 MAG: hypothetical protein A2Y32_01925 [Spirochaetes bacterium GWF1_60_12]HAW86549.1 hypothetical protein [Spirochaetaceae bacterium]
MRGIVKVVEKATGFFNNLLGAGRLSAATRQSILEQRQRGGAFGGFIEFLDRVRPPLDDCRALIRSGSLDGLGGGGGQTRPQLIWLYHQWQRRRKAGDGGELFVSWEAPPGIANYSPAIRLRDELDFLGLVLSVSLPALFLGRAEKLAASLRWPAPVGSAGLPRLAGRQVCLLGVDTACKEVQTKQGDAMCFKSFMDGDGVYETVVFPKVYGRIMPILENNIVFLILGTVQLDFGAPCVHIVDVAALNRQS